MKRLLLMLAALGALATPSAQAGTALNAHWVIPVINAAVQEGEFTKTQAAINFAVSGFLTKFLSNPNNINYAQFKNHDKAILLGLKLAQLEPQLAGRVVKSLVFNKDGVKTRFKNAWGNLANRGWKRWVATATKIALLNASHGDAPSAAKQHTHVTPKHIPYGETPVPINIKTLSLTLGDHARTLLTIDDQGDVSLKDNGKPLYLYNKCVYVQDNKYNYPPLIIKNGSTLKQTQQQVTLADLLR